MQRMRWKQDLMTSAKRFRKAGFEETEHDTSNHKDIEQEVENEEDDFENILNDAIQKSREHAARALAQKQRNYDNFLQTAANALTIVGRTFYETIYPMQLQKLRSVKGWLGSTILNTYASLIAEDFQTIGVLSSYFVRNDCNKLVFDAKKWILGSGILTKELVFVPINTKNFHWSLIVIDMSAKVIIHLDSLNEHHSPILRSVMEILVEELVDVLSSVTSISSTSWQSAIYQPCPKQSNGDDCGVFVCYFMQFLAETVSGQKKPAVEAILLLAKLSSVDTPEIRRLIEARLTQNSI